MGRWMNWETPINCQPMRAYSAEEIAEWARAPRGDERDG
jgi:hypothetical protein